MSDEYNQNERTVNELEKALIAEGMPQWSIKKGLESGYEARLINPDGGCVPGNVVWAITRHLDALEDYWNGEIGKVLAERATAPAPPATPVVKRPVEVVVKSRRIGGSGKLAYEARAAGAAWADIPVKSALNAAKSHAKTHGLTWPPA